MLIKIQCEQVSLGMYIQGFGGSWFDHPFWRARFLLDTPENVERVRQSGVPYVLIDDERGIGVAQSSSPTVSLPHRPQRPARVSRQAASRQLTSTPVEPQNSAERRRAVALVSRSKKVVRYVFDGARLGRAVCLADVVSVVDEIAEAMAVIPQTLLGVIQLKNKDEYTYLHSVAVCALMVCTARHLGMERDEVRELGLAGLLHDIGKMGIPDTILNKQGRLTDVEFQAVRKHPEFGHDLLRKAPDIPELALDVCLNHHEKVDGTGYPSGLTSEEISLAARLGAICDVYDALTSDRAYKAAWKPQKALGEMWQWEGHFDRSVLFAFMQAIGTYPVDLLVRLRSNRLGVVLEKQRRTAHPRVLVFYATREQAFIDPEVVVIRNDLGGDQAISPEEPDRWGFTDWDDLRNRLTSDKGKTR